MLKKGRTGADQKREKYSLFIADSEDDRKLTLTYMTAIRRKI
jgi:hypothetical protein